ncbi:MAG: EscU/YscU/HrcU family type III secretion system export apparatus switch protein [Deferrisomatales bacterium]|nr:EscU/YscU/HrcU family type III secretion system export apparatus switch protein [Deferrisomatales bacterium]
MAADEEWDRTEPATPKRRREARERGDVARSPEVVTAFVLAAGVLGFWVGARSTLTELHFLASDLLRFGTGPELTGPAVVTLAARAAGCLIRALTPVLVAVVAGGIAGNLLQVGFLFSFRAVAPDVGRLDPFEGFRHLFRRARLLDLLRNLLKVASVGFLGYVAVRSRLGELPFLAALPAAALLTYLLDLGFEILRNILLFYAALALLDYGLQRWQWEDRIRMSKQEVKDEYRDTEGDPLVKSRLRSLQRELARRRMMAEVPGADLIVTDPTRLAVALRYDTAERSAPRVVGKGAGAVAERMGELGRGKGVPVYEAPSLAGALYRRTEIGEPIPSDLFEPVAELLARAYRGTGGSRGGPPGPGGLKPPP